MSLPNRKKQGQVARKCFVVGLALLGIAGLSISLGAFASWGSYVDTFPPLRTPINVLYLVSLLGFFAGSLLLAIGGILALARLFSRPR